MIRLILFGLLAMALGYGVVSIYSRSVRREKLEREWAQGDSDESRDAFVRRGMAEYDASFRKKLILLVFVVPVILVAALIYITNFT